MRVTVLIMALLCFSPGCNSQRGDEPEVQDPKAAAVFIGEWNGFHDKPLFLIKQTGKGSLSIRHLRSENEQPKNIRLESMELRFDLYSKEIDEIMHIELIPDLRSTHQLFMVIDIPSLSKGDPEEVVVDVPLSRKGGKPALCEGATHPERFLGSWASPPAYRYHIKKVKGKYQLVVKEQGEADACYRLKHSKHTMQCDVMHNKKPIKLEIIPDPSNANRLFFSYEFNPLPVILAAFRRDKENGK